MIIYYSDCQIKSYYTHNGKLTEPYTELDSVIMATYEKNVSFPAELTLKKLCVFHSVLSKIKQAAEKQIKSL